CLGSPESRASLAALGARFAQPRGRAPRSSIDLGIDPIDPAERRFFFTSSPLTTAALNRRPA
ncbi:MAG TPA: hypothetical protein DFS52_04125, partial [Myxococcales bacterium]|nr:hypothetical protein [Myxococcales bacterium]